MEQVPQEPEEQPHDILAAEEHAIPAEEPSVPHDRDPNPHDVLAAEEFAIPAPDPSPAPRRGAGSLPWAGGLLILGAALLALRHRRKR